jgi:hypothetical protein
VIVFLLLATAAWGQTIYVNRWHRGDQPSDGTAGRPFRSLTEAYNAAPLGRMTTIQVETGVYPERPTLGSAPSRQVTLVARGGPVTIGVFSPNVLTQHNDNERTGANLQEVVLNTSNVNAQRFGKLFERVVDGHIYAQPLYVSNVTIPGRGIRNVVYVATMHNTVYAFDADDPNAATPFWSRSLGTSIPVPDPLVPGTARPNIQVEIGIIGTPVISLTYNALYVVAATKEGSNYLHRLHALDLTTGAGLFGGPRVISTTFDSTLHNQRAALLLANNLVYVAFAAYADAGDYHGWIFAYHLTTLNRVAEYNPTPAGKWGGIWQAGQGPAADSQGNIYFMTGNGSFNGDQRVLPPPDRLQLGDSFVKLRPNLTLADWFSPCNNKSIDQTDWDLGSAGPLLVPDSRLLVGAGKQGKMYVLDKNSLGGFRRFPPCGVSSSCVDSDGRWRDGCCDNSMTVWGDNPQYDPQIIQWFYVSRSIPNCTATHHVHGSPVYWNGPNGKHVYVWPENDYIMAFRLIGERFDPPRPFSRGSTISPEMPGGFLSISANGNMPDTGIVWASHPFSDSAEIATVDGILRAYDASNFIVVDPMGPRILKDLWNSRENMSRDELGKLAKFSAPTVANGKVYVGTFSRRLVVYGLLPN